MRSSRVRVIVSIDLREVGHEEVKEVWQIVIEHAVAQEQANEFIVKDVPSPSESPKLVIGAYSALAKASGVEVGSSGSVSGPLSSEIRPLIREIGPYVVNAALYRGPAWVAGISDWGTGIDLNSEIGAWEVIRKEIEAVLPTPPRLDVTPLAERDSQ